MENNGIIYYTAADARAAGTLDAWRENSRALEETRKIVRAAIREHFDGWRLPAETLADVLEKTDAERVAAVLAATLAWIEHDGRISRANKAWARTIRLPEYMRPESTCAPWYILDTHPAILDGFVNMFRAWLDERQ